MRWLASCFWSCAGAAAWILVGYPSTLALAARRRPWLSDDAFTPRVSVIVPTYRELEEMPVKLRALADLDYPPELVDVVVSTDGDARLVTAARDAWPAATVVSADERSGKAAAVNRAVPRAAGEVLILTDANNVLAPGSVRAAVRHLADPAIWAVAGQRLESGSLYDRYEDLLRRLESRSGSVAAVSGDFIAVRAERMPALPAGVVNEDLWLLCDLVRRGGRVVYEPASCSQEPPLGARPELSRRTRIAAGRAMLVSELRGLPPGFTARLISHKHGRLALPFLMAGALGASAGLARRQPYRAALRAQLGFYALALAGATGVPLPGPAGVASRGARQFVLGNLASAAGVVRAARGRQGVRWDPVR